MSIKWKLPLVVLAAFILNLAILCIFYNFFLSDKLTHRLVESQQNIEDISEDISHEIDNESLSSALKTLKDLSLTKNVSIELKKPDTAEVYTFTAKTPNAAVFSASQTVTLDSSTYMLTVKKVLNTPTLSRVAIVRDLIYFEIIIVFIMLFIITLVLYRSYAKPLVIFNDEINQYKDGKLVKKDIKRKDELGQLHASFYELIDSLKEEKQLQDRIIASISHDIKTPLTSVMGYSENLLKKELTPERKKKYLSTIYNQAKDIQGIVEEFDNYVADKLDSELNLQTYSVKYICDMLKDEYSQQLPERNIRFTLVNKSNLNSCLSIDLKKFRRVIANIIGNSIRHANVEELNISISIQEKHKELIFKIHDNGQGVRESEMDHIFEPFYTSDKSRRVSGLGLSICKDIIFAHGGTIIAENSLNGGFSVILSLPSI